MKAIIYEKYGPPEVLQLKEIDKPIPKNNEVLIRVYATTVTLYDCWQRSSTAPVGFGLLSRLSSGVKKPKQPILGGELAGEIEAIGKDVTEWKEGDQVFALLLNLGAYVEYICLPEDGMLSLKPSNLTFEEAAAVPYGALTSLYFLRKADIQKGQNVLIFGASGGIGTYAVQLARYFGAEVTGVCSTSKLDLVKSLGADKIIDYTKEDFTKNGEVYDVIFDTVGKSSVSRSRKSLKKRGFYIFATFGMPKLFQMLWLKLTSSKKIGIGVVEDNTEELIFLKNLIESGKIRPVIDKEFPMEQVIEAHDYVEKGLKKGQVVITLKS